MPKKYASPISDEIRAFLLAYLSEGERPATEVEEAARKKGISLDTLKKVSKGSVLKIQRRDGWYWSVPTENPTATIPHGRRSHGLWPFETISMRALTDREFFGLIEQIDDPLIREICSRLIRMGDEIEANDDDHVGSITDNGDGLVSSADDETRREGYIEALSDIQRALMEIEAQTTNPEAATGIFTLIHTALTQLEGVR